LVFVARRLTVGSRIEHTTSLNSTRRGTVHPETQFIGLTFSLAAFSQVSVLENNSCFIEKVLLNILSKAVAKWFPSESTLSLYLLIIGGIVNAGKGTAKG